MLCDPDDLYMDENLIQVIGRFRCLRSIIEIEGSTNSDIRKRICDSRIVIGMLNFLKKKYY